MQRFQLSKSPQAIVKQINLVGDAFITRSCVVVTNCRARKTGALWVKNPFYIDNGFQCLFSMFIERIPTFTPDEFESGFALVIQCESNTALDKHLEGAGYGRGFHAIARSVAVEIDLEKVKIVDQARTVLANAALPPGRHGIANDQEHSIYVVYCSQRKHITVSLDKKEIVSTHLDIQHNLGIPDTSPAWIGITAATGSQSQSLVIRSFKVHNILDPVIS
eukprot:gene7488-8761_t